ncbi:hypothetical protein EBT16_00835 [bacterium]|nr:hypothetical protein [bacterium]
MTLNLLVSACCLISFLNLIFTILLSNSLFRIVSRLPANSVKSEDFPESGLVDPRPTPTYDTRFRQERR